MALIHILGGQRVMAHYGFLFVPARFAFVSCLVYLSLVAAGWGAIAVIVKTAGIGIWGISGTRMTWVVLNTLLFFTASLIAWRVVIPRVA
jgi:hypothetical protein